MTVQPPPTTGGEAQRGFDPKNVDLLDSGVVLAGLLIFIFSLTSYYTYATKKACVTIGGGKVCAGGNQGDWNAWHGFFGWFATLLALVGSTMVALELFMPQRRTPWLTRLVVLIAYALGAVSIILALFIVPDPYGFNGFDKGHGYGYWISLILIIAGLAMALVRLEQTDGGIVGSPTPRRRPSPGDGAPPSP